MPLFFLTKRVKGCQQEETIEHVATIRLLLLFYYVLSVGKYFAKEIKLLSCILTIFELRR
jgi:hypothetical protein